MPALAPILALPSRPAVPTAICSYCLANPCHTPVAWNLPPDKRCPKCGAAYTGPKREAEYQILRDAGLVYVAD